MQSIQSFSKIYGIGNASRCYYTDPISIAQNNDKELGVEIDHQEQVKSIKNKSKSFEDKSEDRARVENDIYKLAEIGNTNKISIRSQTFPYDQNPMETAEISHINRLIEPCFEYWIGIEKGFLMAIKRL
ncbi:hypothetical protein F8M41_017587 [Gigaspora margarita]|uniref:Uncharacterized protein n=1 Tax=Gigaspora margarita TaxID=4874 RepID=A0A8H4ELY2_GIGMA|nr:hypothetical protein F8M41_017587 [Gigaspora margarita]